MLLDAWQEEEAAQPRAPPPHSAPAVSWATSVEPLRPEAIHGAAARGSESWRALQVQIEAAAATGTFVFGHRRLDGVTALALAQYLRDDCRAKFVDLSHLDHWSQCSLAAAAALKHGLRSARSLVLDGNAIGSCREVLEAWCSAVQEHPGLQYLSLRGTGIDDEGALYLAKALRGNAVLSSLDVGQNRIGDAGLNALAATVRDSVLLEVQVDGTDASGAAQEDLAALLGRNRERFPGGGGAALRGLRKARAAALSAMPQLAARGPAAAGPGGSDRAPVGLEAAPPRLEPREPACERRDAASSVCFEAGGGMMEELSARCEAGWRYNTADRDVLTELRAKIGDMKIEGELEHRRADEVLSHVAELQASSSKKLRPEEDRIIRLKEELSVEIEATREVLQEQIQRKLLLKAAEEELEDTRQERFRYKLGAEHLEHVLKARNREVAEDLEAMERTLRIAEQEAEALEADNERCRKLLHAMRFETERERFVPSGLAT